MHINPAGFFLIPDRFKTQEMCIEGVEVNPWQLHYVPDRFKTQENAIKQWGKTLPPWNMSLIGLWHKGKQKYGMMTMTMQR